MSHDEKKYHNPEAFMPERFLLDDGTLNEDTVSWVFGFGRRMWCVDARAFGAVMPLFLTWCTQSWETCRRCLAMVSDSVYTGAIQDQEDRGL